MTRTLSGGEAQESGVEAVWLLEVVFWDGTSEVPLHLTTAADDVTSTVTGSSQTFTGAGDFLEWGSVRETDDDRAQGTRVTLSGVDTTVMSTLLSNDFRGRRLRLWRARIEDGAVTDTRLAHRGVQLEDYEISEQRPEEGDKAPTIEISTRSVSRLAAMQTTNAVRTNPRSHAAMLARAGLSTVDNFFQYVAQLPGRVFWGTESPDPALDGTGPGDPGGGGGGPGTGDEFQPGLPGQ